MPSIPHCPEHVPDHYSENIMSPMEGYLEQKGNLIKLHAFDKLPAKNEFIAIIKSITPYMAQLWS